MAEATSEKSPNWVSLLRGFVAIVVAAVILGGPFVRQILHQGAPLVPRWQMFSGKGLGYYSLRFVAVTPDNGKHEVDWDLIYPEEIPEHPPLRVNRIRDKRGLRGLSRQVCRRLGKGTELYVHARKAVRTGWKQVGDPAKDACVRPRRPKKNKGRNNRAQRKNRGARGR